MLAHLTIVILALLEVVLHVGLLLAQERYVTQRLTNRLLSKLLLPLVRLILMSDHLLLLLARGTQMRPLVRDDVGSHDAQASTLVPIVW